MRIEIKILFLTFCLGFMPAVAHADNDLSEAYREGYKTWKKTSVKGGFQGCTVGKILKFENGLSFKCTENEEGEQSAAVTILKNSATGAYRVFIGDDHIEGQLQGAKKR